MRFQFDERKGVEALLYLTSRWEGVTAFYASKVLFFAEKFHLNRYGRPIIADTFIAMPNGPVPSTLYDFMKGQFGQAGDPEAARSSLDRSGYPRMAAAREPRLEWLSESDVECLNDAIEHCRRFGYAALSQRTHQEAAWARAPANGPMDYSHMFDRGREDARASAEEFAAYGLL